MSLSRWKMMAGVLGVSIGGLAAAASQCPKWDKSKGRSPETPIAMAEKADGKLPPAGPPSTPVVPPTAPTTTVPVPSPELPTIPPAAPQLAPAGSTPPAPPAPTNVLPPLPDFPAMKPADVTPPVLPPIPSSAPTAPMSKPEAGPIKPGTPSAPPAPIADLVPPTPAKPTPPISAPPTTPPAPAAGPDGRGLTGTPMFTGPAGEPLPLNPTKPAIPPVVGASGTQPTGPNTPVASPPNVGGPMIPAPGTITPAPPAGLPDVPPSGIETPPLRPAPTVPVAESKFRILLRVGEGEPTFEVKNGDNLVLKVACEKVDIKSPEKGSGLSEVTARGKVRFVGFGAEGTCNELKFMAGTGQVEMTGDVKVQVKDKLGRVESELTTGTLKYKIDASAVAGQIKP